MEGGNTQRSLTASRTAQGTGKERKARVIFGGRGSRKDCDMPEKASPICQDAQARGGGKSYK